MPEKDEFDLILNSVNEIYADIQNAKNNDLLLFEKFKVDNLTGDITEISSTEFQESEEINADDKNQENRDKK